MGLLDSVASIAKGTVNSLTNTATSVVNGAIGAATQIGTGIQQTVANFSSPSQMQKQGEGLMKMASTGNAGLFKQADKTVGVNATADGVSYTDAHDRKLIAQTQSNIGSTNVGETYQNFPDETTKQRVRIIAYPNLRNGLTPDPDKDFLDEIEFIVTPVINESRSASYSESTMTPVQHPGGVVKYQTTQSRQWTVSGKLIARTPAEAAYNLKVINTIRSWVMPFYGMGTEKDPTTAKYLGAPPPVLTLSAYGRRMVGPVTCVLESYHWDFPDDVDYIPTAGGTLEPGGKSSVSERSPFPAIISISLTLKETWAPKEFTAFDLMKYKRGDLTEAFGGAAPSAPKAAGKSSTPDGITSGSVPDPSTVNPDGAY